MTAQLLEGKLGAIKSCKQINQKANEPSISLHLKVLTAANCTLVYNYGDLMIFS